MHCRALTTVWAVPAFPHEYRDEFRRETILIHTFETGNLWRQLQTFAELLLGMAVPGDRNNRADRGSVCWVLDAACWVVLRYPGLGRVLNSAGRRPRAVQVGGVRVSSQEPGVWSCLFGPWGGGALSEGNVNLRTVQFILPSSFLLAASKVSEMTDFQMFYKMTFRNYFLLKK